MKKITKEDKKFWDKVNKKVINLPGEEWRPIKGWESYEVSNMGRVKRTLQERFYSGGKSSLYSEKLMNQCFTEDGYAQVTLKQFGRRGTYYVHRLVLFAFDILPPTPEHTEVNHKDQNTKNNRLDNLEWVTPKENKDYGNRPERISISLKKHYQNLSYEERTASLKYAHEARKRKVKCDNQIYNSVKEFASNNQLVYSTVIQWLRGVNPMPQEWQTKGLSYMMKGSDLL